MGNQIFARQIKNIRLNLNKTMEEFAEMLGVTKSSINMWENKGVVPREAIFRKIAETQKISLDKLLGIEFGDQDGESKIMYLQRNLKKLDEKRLKKAEDMLKVVFDDIFDDEEDDDGI